MERRLSASYLFQAAWADHLAAQVGRWCVSLTRFDKRFMARPAVGKDSGQCRARRQKSGCSLSSEGSEPQESGILQLFGIWKENCSLRRRPFTNVGSSILL